MGGNPIETTHNAAKSDGHGSGYWICGMIMRMSSSESGSAPLFPLSRWREGYKCAEVDEFVHRLRVSAAGEISASEVREVRFAPERWAKPGYDLVAVDAYLDAVAARMEAGGSPDSIPLPGSRG